MSARTALRPPHWAGFALVVAVILAGCSEPDQPGTVPPATSTPSTTTSTPSPTVTSAKQQVEAAVRTYYEELEAAIQTNDTSGLKRLVLESCPCYGSVRSIDEAAAQRRQTPDASIRIVSLSVHDVFGKTAAADVAYDVNAYDVMDRTGTIVNRVPARKDRVDLSFVMADAGWVVANVFNLGGR